MAASNTKQSVQAALARLFGVASPFVATLQLPAACDDNNLKILYARQADVLELLSVHAWLKELGLCVEDPLAGVVVAVQLLSGHIRLRRVAGSTPRLTRAGVLDAASSTLELPDGSSLALGRIIDKMPEQVLKGVWLTAVKDAQQQPADGGFELGSMQEVLTSIYRLNKSMRMHQHLGCVSKLLSGQPMSVVARLLPSGVSSLAKSAIPAMTPAVEALLMQQEASIRSHLQQALNVLYESPSETLINQIHKMIRPRPAVVEMDQTGNGDGAMPGVPVVAPVSAALGPQQGQAGRGQSQQQPSRHGPEITISRAYANGSALPGGRADGYADGRPGARADDRDRHRPSRRSLSPDHRRISKRVRSRSRSRSPHAPLRRPSSYDAGLGRRPEALPARDRRRSPSPVPGSFFNTHKVDHLPAAEHVEAAVKLMIKMRPLPVGMPVQQVHELLQVAALWEFLRNGGTHQDFVLLSDMRLPPALLANGESEAAAVQRALRAVPNGPLTIDSQLRLHLCPDFARACKKHSYFREQVHNAGELARRWLTGRGEGVMSMEAFLELFAPEAKLYMELFSTDRELINHCFGIHFKARPHPTQERMLIVPAGQSPRASPTDKRRRELSPPRATRPPLSRRVSDNGYAADPPAAAMMDAPPASRSGSTLAVRNLPLGLPVYKMEQLLTGFFGRFGELAPDGVRVPEGPDAPGFVTFMSSTDAAEVVRKSQDGERPFVVQGRRLDVNLAPSSRSHRPRDAAPDAGGRDERRVAERRGEHRVSVDGSAGVNGSREERRMESTLLGANGDAAMDDRAGDGAAEAMQGVEASSQGHAASAERPASRDANEIGEQAARDQGPNTGAIGGAPQVLHLHGNGNGAAADAVAASEEELQALVLGEGMDTDGAGAGGGERRSRREQQQGDADVADMEAAAAALLSMPSGDLGHGLDRRPMLDQSLDDIARARKEQARSEAKMQQLRQALPPHQRAESSRYPPSSPKQLHRAPADLRPSEHRPDPRNLKEDEQKIRASIFVCNMPYGCATVAGLQQIFMQYGFIEHIKVDQKTSQGSWGVVTFRQIKDAQELLRRYEMGVERPMLHGREIHMKPYRPAPPAKMGGRGIMQPGGGSRYGRPMQY